MKKITLEVSDSLAEKLEKLPADKRRELEGLLEVYLNDKRSLSEVMNDMSAYAKKQGLTPEILDDR